MAGWNGIMNCGCKAPEIDSCGRVLTVQTCPACQAIRLDVIRGAEYACAYENGHGTLTKVLLKQKELFS